MTANRCVDAVVNHGNIAARHTAVYIAWLIKVKGYLHQQQADDDAGDLRQS